MSRSFSGTVKACVEMCLGETWKDINDIESKMRCEEKQTLFDDGYYVYQYTFQV